MSKTLAEIAQAIGGVVSGDETCAITGIAGIKEAQPGDLTFLGNSKYLPLLKTTKASAIIVDQQTDAADHNVIKVDNPTLAFSQAIELFFQQENLAPKGVSDKAYISDHAKLHASVSVGAGAIIEADATIGENTVIYPGAYIAPKTSIGSNCAIFPNVSIYHGSEIGNNVIIHSGTVVGSDGFGFVQIEEKYVKIPQVGIVVIEDDVEIGANVTIDRARFDKTIIGQGTKIDNLVQIAHNVVIGRNCVIVSQVGISGSTHIEDNVIIAGQAGIVGHLTIGKGAVIMAQSGVSRSVKPGECIFGSPAKPHKQALSVNAHLQRLPDYATKIKELTQRIDALENK